jgi:hypothetical protein
MEIIGSIIGIIVFIIVLWLVGTSDNEYHYPDTEVKNRK